MSIDTVARVLDEIPAPAHDTVARLVRHITHDLRSPASAVMMEVFSSRALLDDLRAGMMNQGDGVRAIGEAEAMFENLGRATQALLDYLSAVEACLGATPTGAPGARP